MEPSLSPWADLLWVAMGVGLLVYCLTGGADLGAGLWTVLARGKRRDAQRVAVREAIAPIWEANHVWLIFVVVVMFSAFPRAFAALCIALHVPLSLALVGLVFRGAAFAFHGYGIQSSVARGGWERVFALSSLVTPFFLGCVVGGLSGGEIRLQQGQVVTGFFAGWTSAFSLSVGVFATALFALLAAVYLAAETDGALSADFRRRALAAEMVAGGAAAGVFLLARFQAPLLYRGLADAPWFWGVQGAAAGSAGAVMLLLWKGRARIARWAVALQVALVVLGWGLAMDRHFILPDLGFAEAGSSAALLPALVLALAVGALLLIPALFFLYRVFKLPARPRGPSPPSEAQ